MPETSRREPRDPGYLEDGTRDGAAAPAENDSAGGSVAEQTAVAEPLVAAPASGGRPAPDTGPAPRSARTERLRKVCVGVVITALSVSVLVLLLFLAAWRNDYLIESDKGATTGEVLSAGRLRSAVMYVTPDGVTHNPKVGVLYPTNLTAGERINVEYSRADPDLVRVAGRDVRVAILPTLSVLAVTWAITLPTLWLLMRAATGSMSVRPIFDPASYRRRVPGDRGRAD
ncbi:hypothetical protein GCM10011588_67480 [Nocardia jinanensis]|uniref:DUF3592 domain-containing protein n=1 Tax=Nocardia jinanensis TaxID=382504 RepID=A0A917RXP3_9NOCA|nr:hypothetical protein GCM10011588_67480 [Nocardia jinanensis]